MKSHYKRIVLNKRPVGDFETDTFRTEVVPFNLRPGQGQAVVQCTYLSLDPAMRGWVRDVRSYLPPVKIGEVRNVADLHKEDTTEQFSLRLCEPRDLVW